MNDPDNIFKTLNNLKKALHFSPGAPYSVPPGYFDELAPKIIEQIYYARPTKIGEDGEIQGILEGASKSMPYQVPEGYFSHTGFSFALLKEHGKTPVFSIPQNYFGSLPENILKKIKRGNDGVFTLPHIGLKKYAVAVAIGLILLVSIGVVRNNTSEKQTEADAAGLVQKTIHNISTEQLAGFLNIPDSVLMGSDRNPETVFPELSIDFNQLLKKMSEKELKKFLEETGGDEERIFIN